MNKAKSDQAKTKSIKTKTPLKKGCLFSFEYWKQAENFGLGSQPTGWFLSLLEKIREYAKEDLEKLMGDYAKRSQQRFHKIDYRKAKPEDHITLTDGDFHHLPEDIYIQIQSLKFIKLRYQPHWGVSLDLLMDQCFILFI